MPRRYTRKKRARVLIVDQQPAVREALAIRIGRHRDLEVCGQAADSLAALRLVDESLPDVAVIDIALKSGMDLIKRIKAHNEQVRILVWSRYSESFYAERALRAGALGYINKDQATDRVVDAIRRVYEGKLYLSDDTAEQIMHGAVGSSEDLTRSAIEALADRELEVFRLIGEGVKTADIAKELHLSIKTVETYRDRIRQKLGFSDAARLAHYATQWVLQHE
jgi:DNA-binding NarL/FixJ family response regulator